MLKHAHKFLVACVLSFAIILPAKALLPLGAAVVWLGQVVAAQPLLAVGVEASLAVHGSLLAYSLFFAEKTADGAPASPAIEIKLTDVAVRANPDPEKWDDPAPGQRDPTPKAQVPAAAPASPYSPLTGGAPGYTSNCTASVYGSSPEAVAAACAVAATNSWPAFCRKPYSSFCDASGCYIVRPEMDGGSGGGGHCSADEATSSVNISSTTIPASVECASGMSLGGGCISPEGEGTCPSGYTANGSTCDLTNPADVKKPETHPCEILRSPSGVQSDAANDNCANVQVQGNSVSVGNQNVSFNADGSVSVSNPNGQTTFQLGTPNSDGSVPITGVSRTGNPYSYSPTGSGSSLSGTITQCGGVDQPACSGSGDGGGSCGGPGQAKCAIDDSGFSGLGDPGAAGRAGLDDAFAARGTAIQNSTDTSSNLGLGFDWVPKPGNFNTACEPIIISRGPINIAWDFCPYVPLLAQVMGYLFYIFTGLYLWRTFIGSNSTGGK